MKLFKSYSEKEVKKVRPIVDKINSLEEEISKLSDQELTKKTAYFKECKGYRLWGWTDCCRQCRRTDTGVK